MRTPSGGAALSGTEYEATCDPMCPTLPVGCSGERSPPWKGSPSPGRRSQIAATAGPLRRRRAATRRRRLLDLNLGVVLERSQRLEAPRHDLVSRLETLDDFHVGRSHDPGLDLNELCHPVPHYENTLQLFLLS